MACCSKDKELPLDRSTRILPPTDEGPDKKKQETPYIVFTYGVAPPNLAKKRLSSGLCKYGIDKIACGSSHFLLLTENHVLLVGGNNIYGQCAQKPFIPEGETVPASLKVVQLRLEKHLITDIAAGSYHSLLIAKYEGSNKLMAFGHELGCGFLDREHKHNPTIIVSSELPDDDPPVKVFAGRMRSAVVLRSGKVKMWGEWYNGAKQRALRGVDIALTDQDMTCKIVMGQFHALFLSREGKIFSWGDNTYGELGAGRSEKWRSNPKPIEFFHDKRCLDCDVGGRHSLVLTDDNTLYSFGDNSEGQCGIEMNRTYDPVAIETKGMLGEDTVYPIYIFAGDAHSALVTNEGDLFAWGDNSEQRLGIHTTSSIFRPTLVEDVMGRNLSAVGLGGFFSIFVTGPKEFAIGRKNLAEKNTRKIFTDMIFGKLGAVESTGNAGNAGKVKNSGLVSMMAKGIKNAQETKIVENYTGPEEQKVNRA